MKFLEIIRGTLIVQWPVLGTVKLERLINEPGNEMWRIGRGYHNTTPFLRIDWGTRGWRWTWGIKWFQAYFELVNTLSPEAQTACQAYLDKLMVEAIDSKDKVTITRNHAVVREPRNLWKNMYHYAISLK